MVSFINLHLKLWCFINLLIYF